MNRLRAFLILLLSFSSLLLAAQIPSDLSNVKSSQISDNQLKQYIQQAKANGISMERFEAELTRRGLAPEELSTLKQRIADIEQGNTTETETTGNQTDQQTQQQQKRSA